MTQAVQVIQSEHAGIWRLMATIDQLNQALASADVAPDRDLFGAIFDYLQSYTDQMHHPKEDLFLFRALRERAPESHPVLDELQREHARGPSAMLRLRDLMGRACAGEANDRAAFREALSNYVNTQREHIRKEETQVLPLAQSMLTDADWRVIDEAFLANDDPLFGQSVRTEFRDLHRRITNLAPAPMGLGLSVQPRSEQAAADRAAAAMLDIQGLSSHYGRIQALDGIELTVAPGELVALVGANGAGKTTLLRSISGLQSTTGGTIRFRGQDITRIPAARRVGMGISQVPEGRQVFGPLSVEDNLRLGAFHRGRDKGVATDLERMYAMFPILEQKRKQPAGTLSGGQQQMLAIARALMARPSLLLLDEPSMGLAPLLVQEIFNAVADLKRQGITLFLVEQNAAAALAVADRGYVIETGRVVLSGAGRELLANEEVKKAYLGM